MLKSLNFLLAVLFCMTLIPAQADQMDLIHKRGVIVIGVKGDFPPFGKLDPAGNPIGFEPDLAADFAQRLGVQLRLTTVTSANRLSKLEDGSVDMIIATLGDTSDRRKIATIVEPAYYATGASVMLRPDANIRDWNDLRNKKVCATQGALYNKPMAQRYFLDLQIFGGNRDAGLALAGGRCIGWLYDAATISSLLKETSWAGYKMPLPQVLESPWGIAVSRAERGQKLELAIGDAIANWHRSGLLIDLEKKWGLPPSKFLADAKNTWKATNADGSYVCQRKANGLWVPECRNKALLNINEVSGLYRLAFVIKESTGLDISLLYDSYDRSVFLGGLFRTLGIILIAVPMTILIGGCLGFILFRRMPVISSLCRGGMAFIRMTPPLLQIYLVYFGIGGIFSRHGVDINGLCVAAICLACYNGAALAISFVESAEELDRTIGFDIKNADDRRALLALVYTPLFSIAVNVVKMTGMASAIAVPELINASTQISGEHGNLNVMMNLLLIIYFLIVVGVVQLFARLERRYIRVAA